MTTTELIDKLCAVTAMQADIIRKQALFIENCLTVDREAKESFEAMRRPAEDELELLEYEMRKR